MSRRLLISILLICTSYLNLYETSPEASESNECSANREFKVLNSAAAGAFINKFNTEFKEPPYADSSGNEPEKQKSTVTRDTSTNSAHEAVSAQSLVHRDEPINKDNIVSTISPSHSNDQTQGVQWEDTIESDATEPDPALTLPPLDDAAVGGIEQHQIPTFNEFHAMLSENGDSKLNKGAVPLDHERVGTNDDNKQGPATIHANPTDSSNVLEHGSLNRSQTATITEDDGTKPSSPAPPVTDRRSGSSRTISDSAIVIESNGEPVTSQSDRSDDANPRPSVSASTVTSSDQMHAAEHHTPADRPVTLRRNVAAVVCGAKLLDSSQAIKNAEAVLNGNNDEYMNVPCSADKWFVIEVCEPVQLRVIELANYELFSSRVKSFKVFVSDRYPAKSWELVGQFVARDIKGLQNFDVTSDKLIKFVKFEMLEHYGSEHYCPLTMIRLFGLVSDDLDDEEVDNMEAEAARTLMNTAASAQPVPSPNPPTVLKPSPTEAPTIEPASTTNSGMISNQFGDSAPITGHSPTASHDTIAKSPELVLPPRPRRAPTDIWPKRFSSGSSSVTNPGEDPTTSDVAHIVDRSSDPAVVPKSAHPKEPPMIISKSNRCQMSVEDQCLLDEAKSDHESCVGSTSQHSEQPESHSATQPKFIQDLSEHQDTNPIQIPQKDVDSMPLPPPSLLPSRQQPEIRISRQASESSSTKQHSGFFERMKEFFVGLLSFSIKSILPLELDHGLELNLSDIPVCSRHMTAIDSLMAYGLLNTSYVGTNQLSTKYVEHLLPQLSESKRVGLTNLQLCLFYLNNLTQSIVSSELQSPANVIRSPTSSFTLYLHQHPTLWACYEASKHLGLALHPAISSSDSSAFKYSLLHLLVAFQYRERLRLRARTLSFPVERADVGEVALFQKDQSLSPTEPWWILSFPDPLHRLSQCPKLPEFLLSDFVKTTDTGPSGFSESDSESTNVAIDKHITSSVSPKHAVNQSPSQSWIDPRGATREEIVVPAALTGSRKDTLLMRLNNRVRLLERNVSVSMRYLEELSQSYRRQMERLSRSFNLTTSWLKATAQGAEERDQLQQTRIDEIEIRLANLVAQLRSGQLLTAHSNDSVESNNATAPGVSSMPSSSNTPKSSFPLDRSPPPPPLPPTFDASLEWAPTYGHWPQVEDDWLDEDGVVETEDEDFSRPVYSSWIRGQTDDRRSDAKSRTSMSSLGSSSSGIPPTINPSHAPGEYERHDVPSNLLIHWLGFLYNWFATQLSYIPLVSTEHWMLRISTPNNNAIWMIYMALLHITLAMCSHLLIYWTWLRPHSRKWQSNLLTLPISTVPSWPVIPVVGLEAMSSQQQHRHHTMNSATPQLPKRPKCTETETGLFNQMSIHQVGSSCNHVGGREYPNLSNAAPSIKPIPNDSPVVPVSLSPVASPTLKGSDSLRLCSALNRTVNGLHPPSRFVISSQGRNMVESVSSVKVDTIIEEKPATVIDCVSSNQFKIQSPSSSNLVMRTNHTQSVESYNSCNGQIGEQLQSTISQPALGPPKLSRNAIRRRNRRDKAKRKEKPHTCHSQ